MQDCGTTEKELQLNRAADYSQEVLEAARGLLGKARRIADRIVGPSKEPIGTTGEKNPNPPAGLVHTIEGRLDGIRNTINEIDSQLERL